MSTFSLIPILHKTQNESTGYLLTIHIPVQAKTKATKFLTSNIVSPSRKADSIAPNIGVKKLYIVMFPTLLYLYSVDHTTSATEDKRAIYNNSIPDSADAMYSVPPADFPIAISIKLPNISCHAVVTNTSLVFTRFLLYILLIEPINAEKIKNPSPIKKSVSRVNTDCLDTNYKNLSAYIKFHFKNSSSI